MISGPIFQALRGIVDNRCYPSTFPQPPAVPMWPAIRYTISADANPDLCGTDDGSGDNFTVQFDCVDRTYGAADALRDAVVAALEGFRPPAIRESEFQTYDTETKTHRFVLVYSFHPSFTGPLQVVCREIVAVLDVCDVGTPVASGATDESAGISDTITAWIELSADVSETLVVTATDAVAPATLEAAGLLDVTSATADVLGASVDEVAGVLDSANATAIAVVATLDEIQFVNDSSAAGVITGATQSEFSAVSDGSDAALDGSLVVSWLSLTEDEEPLRVFVSWARVRMPEFAGARVYVAWAEIEIPGP